MKSGFSFFVGLITGLILGYLATRELFAGMAKKMTYSDQTLTIITDVNNLTSLRRGQIENVIDEKENELSWSIYEFYLVYSNKALSMKDSKEILERAANYRSAHPYKTGDEKVDQIVDGILGKLNSGVTH